MNDDVEETVLTPKMHLVIAGLLTVAIIASFIGSDQSLRAEIRAVHTRVETFDRNWCERINTMHRINHSIEVIDCETNEINLRVLEPAE